MASAEAAPFPNGSIDLITVAQAVHWFDLDAFCREVRRVSKPTGILAVWRYGFSHVSPAIDDIVFDFEQNYLKAYWTSRNALAQQGYSALPFPFSRVEAPAFFVEQEYDIDQFLGFLGIWSAVQRYKEKHDDDPLRHIRDRLAEAWGDVAASRVVHWDIELLVGRTTGK